MRTRTALVAIAAGGVLGIGGIAAVDTATGPAEAQGGGSVTQADLKGANQRSQAAINGYKNLNNLLGKYVAEENSLIGAKSGPITQDRGIGGGLPMDVLSERVQGKLGPPRVVNTSPAPIAGFATNQASARCADDEVAIAGGYELGDSAVSERSAPSGDGKAWEVRAFAGPGGGSVQAFVLCQKA